MSVDVAYKERRDELTRKLNENALLNRQIDDNETKMEQTIIYLTIGQESLTFLEKIANSRRAGMKTKIESVLSEALQLVYGPTYRVEMSYTVKRNRSDMTIEVVRKTPQGEVRRDPTTGTGGGVADTITVPLRLLVLLGSKQTDKVALLDEPYKHVDTERVEIVAEFLKVLSDRLDMQTIVLSHHEQMQDKADKSYEVSEKDGISKVVER